MSNSQTTFIVTMPANKTEQELLTELTRINAKPNTIQMLPNNKLAMLSYDTPEVASNAFKICDKKSVFNGKFLHPKFTNLDPQKAQNANQFFNARRGDTTNLRDAIDFAQERGEYYNDRDPYRPKRCEIPQYVRDNANHNVSQNEYPIRSAVFHSVQNGQLMVECQWRNTVEPFVNVSENSYVDIYTWNSHLPIDQQKLILKEMKKINPKCRNLPDEPAEAFKVAFNKNQRTKATGRDQQNDSDSSTSDDDSDYVSSN